MSTIGLGDPWSPCPAMPFSSPRRVDDALPGLVRRARGGDQQAWREVIRLCQPRLRSVLAAYRLQPADVEDVLQDVWIRCFEHLDAIREPVALPGWLATTARREALRVLRHHARAELCATVGETELGPGPGCYEETLASELSRRLHAAVRRLPHRHQRLILATLLEPQVTQRELAHRLAMPLGSVGPIRVRSLGRLRQDAALAGLARAA